MPERKGSLIETALKPMEISAHHFDRYRFPGGDGIRPSPLSAATSCRSTRAGRLRAISPVPFEAMTPKPLKTAKRSIRLSRRQARHLLTQIASMCEKAYRRGAQHAAVLGLSEEDAQWFRYECADRYRYRGSLDFHQIAHPMPKKFTPGQIKDWPDQAKINPGRYYAQRITRTALDCLKAELTDSRACCELAELLRFAEHHPATVISSPPGRPPAHVA
jgi:hypothetical protein